MFVFGSVSAFLGFLVCFVVVFAFAFVLAFSFAFVLFVFILFVYFVGNFSADPDFTWIWIIRRYWIWSFSWWYLHSAPFVWWFYCLFFLAFLFLLFFGRNIFFRYFINKFLFLNFLFNLVVLFPLFVEMVVNLLLELSFCIFTCCFTRFFWCAVHELRKEVK